MSCFKDGLNDDPYNTCIASPAPHLPLWLVCAGQGSRNQPELKQVSFGQSLEEITPERKKKATKVQIQLACYRPASSAAEKAIKLLSNYSNCPAERVDQGQGRKPPKLVPHGKGMVLKGVEVIEFVPSPKREEGTSTSLNNDQGLTDTESDNDVSFQGGSMSGPQWDATILEGEVVGCWS